MSERFERVSRKAPCEVCGKPDACARLKRYHLCIRVASDRQTRLGWLHPRNGQSHEPIPPPPADVSDEEMAKRWTPIAEKAMGHERVAGLAAKLGVRLDSLLDLGVGYTDSLGKEPCYTFPERNADGLIVGISRRTVCDDKKLFCKGSRRALTYAMDWHAQRGPIFLVEGGSDCAVGITMGLCVLGRPSNTGGIDMLTKLLLPYRRRSIVVLGENDRKSPLHVAMMVPPHDPTCTCCLRCFPGMAGMLQTARLLAQRLGRSVRQMMPPEGIKDLRDWFTKSGVDPMDRNGCYNLGDRLRRGSWEPAHPPL